MSNLIHILDTNVILHESESLLSFQDGITALHAAVLSELDKFKKNKDQIGVNARKALRFIDDLRQYGKLDEGVALSHKVPNHKGIIKVITSKRVSESVKGKIEGVFGYQLDEKYTDNVLLRAALALGVKDDVEIVTKDINLRIMADCCGIKVADYDAEKKVDHEEETFTGYKHFKVTSKKFNDLTEFGHIDGKDFELLPNEFAIVHSKNSKNEERDVIATKKGLHLETIHELALKPIHGISAKNLEQVMALDALLNPNIDLVTLSGQAGTGKTLLTLAAAVEQLNMGRYESIMVARPIVAMGNDIGFLPGDKDEKLSEWMQPIFDNLQFIFSTHAKTNPLTRIQALRSEGRLVMEAIAHIRGRSLPHRFIIIDEAQNLSALEVKTIITRAGIGSKIVLTGDPEQVDNPFVDAVSNGLTYTAECFKNSELHAHVKLIQSERSPLAALAAKIM